MRTRSPHPEQGRPSPTEPATRPWRAASWVLLLAGLVLSALTGLFVRSQVVQRSELYVDELARSVTASVDAALQRDLDLVSSARTYVALQLPGGGSPSLQAWFDATAADGQYPEVRGLGYIERVPAGELGELARAVGVEVAPGQDPAAALRIFPPGVRDVYCLARVGMVAVENPYASSGAMVDFCGGPLEAPAGRVDIGPALEAAASTDGPSFHAVKIGEAPILMVFLPVSLAGGSPVPADLGGTDGWMAGLLRLDTALAGVMPQSTDVHLHLSRAVPGAEPMPVVELGEPGLDGDGSVARTATFDLSGGWLVDLHIQPPATDAEATRLGAFAAGGALVITLLVFALVRVLARSREKAWALVRSKTAELSYQALHDPLTGLPNRALVMDRADHVLARARREGLDPAALFIDLDGFKAVNDTFGHATGDRLLTVVAERLRDAVRDAETVGRLGGDEFVVLLEQDGGADAVTAVAERILAVFTEPVRLPELDEEVVVGATIGVAVGLRDGPAELLRDADVALYEAKATGKGRYLVFRPEMQRAVEERLRADLELRRALDHDQLRLAYVPVLDLASGETTGAAAVVDWTRGPFSHTDPLKAQELADESTLAAPLGRWVLRKACRDVAAWRAAGSSAVVRVRVSVRQARGEGFVQEVTEALADAGVDPSALALELGEAVLFAAPSSRLRDVVDGLRASGVQVVASDFAHRYATALGAGVLAADALKIDREYVAGLGSSAQASLAVDMVIHLGHALGVEVVADGVDEPEVLALLRERGCDQAQGSPSTAAVDADEIGRRLPVRATAPAR
jgi:diguanylate cyclase (GGDEF)-like protein